MRFSGPVRKRVAQGSERYIGLARTLLGEVENRIYRSRLTQLVIAKSLPNGVGIRVGNINGQRFIEITGSKIDYITARLLENIFTATLGTTPARSPFISWTKPTPTSAYEYQFNKPPEEVGRGEQNWWSTDKRFVLSWRWAGFMRYAYGVGGSNVYYKENILVTMADSVLGAGKFGDFLIVATRTGIYYALFIGIDRTQGDMKLVAGTDTLAASKFVASNKLTGYPNFEYGAYNDLYHPIMFSGSGTKCVLLKHSTAFNGATDPTDGELIELTFTSIGSIVSTTWTTETVRHTIPAEYNGGSDIIVVGPPRERTALDYADFASGYEFLYFAADYAGETLIYAKLKSTGSPKLSEKQYCWDDSVGAGSSGVVINEEEHHQWPGQVALYIDYEGYEYKLCDLIGGKLFSLSNTKDYYFYWNTDSGSYGQATYVDDHWTHILSLDLRTKTILYYVYQSHSYYVGSGPGDIRHATNDTTKETQITGALWFRDNNAVAHLIKQMSSYNSGPVVEPAFPSEYCGFPGHAPNICDCLFGYHADGTLWGPGHTVSYYYMISAEQTECPALTARTTTEASGAVLCSTYLYDLDPAGSDDFEAQYLLDGGDIYDMPTEWNYSASDGALTNPGLINNRIEGV